MAISIDPWILDRLRCQFEEDYTSTRHRRRQRTSSPRAQFLEALKQPDPRLPAGCQCHLNDAQYTILGIITSEAEQILRDDPECAVPQPFSLPKLKGFIIRLKSFRIEFCRQSTPRDSSFVVVIDKLEIVTSEKLTPIGGPEFIEDSKAGKSILLGQYNQQQQVDEIASDNTALLVDLDRGPSQTDPEPEWNLNVLRAASFAIHPQEESMLNSAAPPDVPCSIPSLSQAMADDSEGVDAGSLLVSAGAENAASTARHFAPRQDTARGSPQGRIVVLPVEMFSLTPPSAAAVGSRTATTAGVSSSTAALGTVGDASLMMSSQSQPLRPGDSVDGCAQQHQELVDLGSVTSSSGSVVITTAASSAASSAATVTAAQCVSVPLCTQLQCSPTMMECVATAVAVQDTDTSDATSSSKYQTASEHDSPLVPKCADTRFPSNLLDSPSQKLPQLPVRPTYRRAKRRREEKELTQERVRASEARLGAAARTEASARRHLIDSDSSDNDERSSAPPAVSSLKRLPHHNSRSPLKRPTPQKNTEQAQSSGRAVSARDLPASGTKTDAKASSRSTPVLFSSGASATVPDSPEIVQSSLEITSVVPATAAAAAGGGAPAEESISHQEEVMDVDVESDLVPDSCEAGDEGDDDGDDGNGSRAVLGSNPFDGRHFSLMGSAVPAFARAVDHNASGNSADVLVSSGASTAERTSSHSAASLRDRSGSAEPDSNPFDAQSLESQQYAGAGVVPDGGSQPVLVGTSERNPPAVVLAGNRSPPAPSARSSVSHDADLRHSTQRKRQSRNGVLSSGAVLNKSKPRSEAVLNKSKAPLDAVLSKSNLPSDVVLGKSEVSSNDVLIKSELSSAAMHVPDSSDIPQELMTSSDEDESSDLVYKIRRAQRYLSFGLKHKDSGVLRTTACRRANRLARREALRSEYLFWSQLKQAASKQ